VRREHEYVGVTAGQPFDERGDAAVGRRLSELFPPDLVELFDQVRGQGRGEPPGHVQRPRAPDEEPLGDGGGGEQRPAAVGEEFQRACGTSEYFALQVFLRDDDRVFLTYETRGRGVEALGSVWTFLDLTPLGRQEEWEDTPPGRPQSPPYQWWRLHDSYA